MAKTPATTTKKKPVNAPGSRPKTTATEPPAPKKEPFRPSDIPADVGDKAKWLREQGKPNPVRLYRVSSKRKKYPVDPLEINAVDESAAINEFIRRRKIKEPHRYIFRAILLKE